MTLARISKGANLEVELVILVKRLELGDVVERSFDEEGKFLEGKVA